ASHGLDTLENLGKTAHDSHIPKVARLGGDLQSVVHNGRETAKDLGHVVQDVRTQQSVATTLKDAAHAVGHYERAGSAVGDGLTMVKDRRVKAVGYGLKYGGEAAAWGADQVANHSQQIVNGAKAVTHEVTHEVKHAEDLVHKEGVVKGVFDFLRGK